MNIDSTSASFRQLGSIARSRISGAAENMQSALKCSMQLGMGDTADSLPRDVVSNN
jgi:hypothetical protein